MGSDEASAAVIRPGRPAAAPANGHAFGQRIRVPKTAELVAAELRRKIGP